MATFFLLWILFGGSKRSHHYCPPKWPENKIIYASEAILQTSGGSFKMEWKEGQYIFQNGPSTTTVPWGRCSTFKMASAKFWLEPVALVKNMGYTATELRQIHRIAEEHLTLLLEKWHEHHNQ